MKKILLTSLFFLLTACAVQHRETNKLASQLYLQTPQQVLLQMQKIEPPERDYAQYHLNIGLLQLFSSDFKSAIDSLSQAKKEMAALAAISISENAAAGTINETLRSYSGYPTDRVMVHNMLALSYLFNDDIDGARVEMLQADIAMKKLATKSTLSGQLASTHLISGIIYEMLDEQSNALISYRHSEQLIKQRNLTVPIGLQKSLLRLSYRVDRNGQYELYKEQYSGFPTPLVNNNGKQIFSLYFDGVVSHKIENSLLVPSGNGEQLIRISMPAYPNVKRVSKYAKINDTNAQVSTELIENLDKTVREDLAEEYPSILLLTTTRAIAKYELVSQADKQDSLLGALVNLATVLTEVADLRSWNILPSSIQFAYLETNDTEITINTVNKVDQTISLSNGSKNLLLISSLDTPVFHYQQ